MAAVSVTRIRNERYLMTVVSMTKDMTTFDVYLPKRTMTKEVKYDLVNHRMMM